MMHQLLQAVLLGILQGIAEFLPISSSGHLVVMGELLQRMTGTALTQEKLALNIALHLGTLGSILVVYRRDLLAMWRKPRVVLMVALGTIPAAVVGILFKSKLEATFENPLGVGCGWLLTAAALWLAMRFQGGETTLEEVCPSQALTVGAFQMCALIFRGFSRSGSTISGGLMCGLRRDTAAQFSFLLAIPAIGGAALVESRHYLLAGWRALTGQAAGGTGGSASPAIVPLSAADLLPMCVGAGVSFVVGLLALKLLLRWIAQGRLYWFAVYCATIGTATIFWQLYERWR